MSDNLLNKLTQLKLPAMAGSLIRQREYGAHLSLTLQEHTQGAQIRYWPSVPGSQVADHLPGSYDMSRFLNP